MYMQRVVRAGYHPVDIHVHVAQVVEHRQLKSEALVQSRVAAGFSQFSKYIPEPSSCVSSHCTLHMINKLQKEKENREGGTQYHML